MSEIKGQLLGIILTLLVFGSVSIVIARVFANTAGRVNDYSTNVEYEAAGEMGYDTDEFNHQGAIVMPQNVAYPALHY